MATLSQTFFDRVCYNWRLDSVTLAPTSGSDFTPTALQGDLPAEDSAGEYKCNLTKSRQRLKNHFNSKQKIRGRTIRLSLRTGRGSVAGLYFACLFFLTLKSKQALRPLKKPVFFGRQVQFTFSIRNS